MGNAVGDKVDLSRVSSGIMTFRGTDEFSGVNQVRVANDGTCTRIEINLAGGTSPEAAIQVDDGAALASQWRAAGFML